MKFDKKKNLKTNFFNFLGASAHSTEVTLDDVIALNAARNRDINDLNAAHNQDINDLTTAHNRDINDLNRRIDQLASQNDKKNFVLIVLLIVFAVNCIREYEHVRVKTVLGNALIGGKLFYD